MCVCVCVFFFCVFGVFEAKGAEGTQEKQTKSKKRLETGCE